MITLHRLGHKLEIFRLNPDLIVTVEATPDTVITLTTGAKIVVAETPERVVAEIRAFRIDILAGALRRRQELRADGSASHPHVRLAHSNDPSDRAQA
jgi:flagellar protein FlbD